MKSKKNIIEKEHKSEGLTSLSNNIETFVQKLLGDKALVQTDVLRSWEKIVGKDLAEHTFVQRLEFKKDKRDEGTLFLIVSSGGFALEVAQKSPMIIEKINTYFGYKAVAHIKIVQQDSFFCDKDINVADRTKKNLVTKNEQNYIGSIGEGIKNENLKQQLESLARSIAGTQKKED